VEISLANSSEQLQMNEQAPERISPHLGRMYTLLLFYGNSISVSRAINCSCQHFIQKHLKDCEMEVCNFLIFSFMYHSECIKLQAVKKHCDYLSMVPFFLTDCSRYSDLQKHFDITIGASSCCICIQCWPTFSTSSFTFTPLDVTLLLKRNP